MKKKFTRILGVALPLAMVLALAVALIPASTPTAEADVGTLRFGTIPLPKYTADGGRYVLTPAVDVGPIASILTGDTVFAAANITASANITDLLKSADGGDTWTLQTAFRTTAGTDTTSIVAIGTSPEYASDATVFVATTKYVYQTVDGGSEFTAMTRPTAWDTDETINDMDITLDEGGRLSIIIGSSDASGVGDVYVYSPATTGMSWKAQAITSDTLAVAFSPNFASDEGITAVTYSGTATDTEIQFSFGNTKDGGDWGVDIGTGEFLDSGAANITASSACIAFPGDFDVDSLTSNIIFVGLTAGTAGTTAEEGDVYKVTCQAGAASTTEDLNVRGLVSTIRTATNIYSIDASGDAEAANIVVGTDFWSTGVANYCWLSYYSTDSGATWSSAREKSPTGGTVDTTTTTPNTACTAGTAKTRVVMAPDFATSGVIYAATAGADTSAFSRSVDGGTSFNQLSLIDYGTDSYNIFNFTPSADALTMLMSTNLGTAYGGLWPISGGSTWKTTNGGANWERIFSYANPKVTQSAGIHARAMFSPTTIFVIDTYTGKMWRSTDDGVTFPRLVTCKSTALVFALPITDTAIMTWGTDGIIWSTSNLGRPWTKTEESILAGTPLHPATAGSLSLWASSNGKVYVSEDGGITITKTLGITDAGGGGEKIWIVVDENYAENHYVYVLRGGHGTVPGGGIYRIEVNEDDPESGEWVRIDMNSDNYGSIAPGKYGEMKNGVFYCYDSTNVSSGVTGGIWRSVNADADINGTSPPVFTIVNTGLDADAQMGKVGITSDPTTIWMKNSSVNAAYYERILAYADVLATPVAPIEPADGAEDAGIALSTTDLTKDIILSWEGVTGAVEYNLLVCNDAACDSVAQTFTTEGHEQRVQNLIPGKTYYWIVKVTNPILTPWSEVRSFTIGAVEPIGAPVVSGIVSPELGATDVSILPTFVWAEVEGATSYELVVAEDPTFAVIDWSRTSTNTFFKAEEALAYSTAYAWKVTAVPDGPSATGVFTTEAEAVAPAVTEPTEPAEIQIVEVPGAAPIPSYLLWMIIGIGAVLFIALIVLIVRTRRVA